VKRKLLIITSIAIVVILIAIFVHHKKITALAHKKTPPVPVRVAKPLQQSLPQIATTTGSLIAKESTVITPRVSGYIRSILFHEGDVVKSGQVLFQLDNQAEKDALDAAKANYALSKFHYQRDQMLLKKGLIPHSIYFASEVTLKQDQAALQTAGTNLSDRIVSAPFNGTAGGIPVSLGDYVNPGTKLTTLVNNQHLRAEYSLPVKDLNHLQLHQTVLITDATQKNKATATVSYISAAVDQSSQTIAVHADIENTAQLFKPGEYVTVTQTLGMQKNLLLVPEQSVLASINGYHVFVVRKNKAVKIPVKMGERMGSNVVITSGLTANDPVIVAGENEVKDGVDVSEAHQ